jgi:hypothetical protein
MRSSLTIDRHWDAIAAYCKPENNASLGFVEGANNKIRVTQRRAYGIRGEEYLRNPHPYTAHALTPHLGFGPKSTHTTSRRPLNL